MRTQTHLGYVCAGCGAQAVSVQVPGGKRGNGATQVMVPHSVGCPVALHVAALRARALAGKP